MMKKNQKLLCYVVAGALGLSAISSALAEPVEGSTTGENASASANEAYMPKQVAWEVASDTDVEVAVVSIGLSKVIPVKPGFSLVWVNEGYAATDYGPYNRLFLVYHSSAEMPHYEATFFLGRVHSVASVKVQDETSIQIEINLHEKLEPNHIGTPVLPKVQMLVDLTEVNAAIKTPPENEGNLGVSVEVTLSEILKTERSTE